MSFAQKKFIHLKTQSNTDKYSQGTTTRNKLENE